MVILRENSFQNVQKCLEEKFANLVCSFEKSLRDSKDFRYECCCILV